MVTSTTNGITVSVESQYLPEHSNPRGRKYIFGYHISIENGSPNTVQLLRRKWYITDGTGTMREVEGDGVVGRQPIIAPGDSHEYLSFCNLPTEVGKMSGYYTMIRTSDGTELVVEIPEFQMFTPSLFN
ncbi:MAG: Co2+/Mg2+ efflux protein ApaG [Chitinophagales bacterium]|jgi:ApaG protein